MLEICFLSPLDLYYDEAYASLASDFFGSMVQTSINCDEMPPPVTEEEDQPAESQSTTDQVDLNVSFFFCFFLSFTLFLKVNCPKI